MTVVGAGLDSGEGDCPEVTEASKHIAVEAISAEVMRVFMPLILAACPTASNEKLKAGGTVLEFQIESSIFGHGRELDATLKSALSLLR